MIKRLSKTQLNVCKKEIFLCDTNLAILCSLEFGLLASERLQEDFLTPKNLGEVKLEIFFQERVLSNEKNIFDGISMSKLPNFTKPPKVENIKKSRKNDSMEKRPVVNSISLTENKALDLETDAVPINIRLTTHVQYSRRNKKTSKV